MSKQRTDTQSVLLVCFTSVESQRTAADAAPEK